MISDPQHPSTGRDPASCVAGPLTRRADVVARGLAPWRLVAATLVALLAVAMLATPAAAHAYLMGSDPTDGAALDAAPQTITLTFNEPVETDDQALRLFDASGERVDDGPLDTDPDQIAVAVPTELPDAAYVVAYRVISADSHPIAGTLSFTVGDATPLDEASVAAIGGAEAGVIGVVGAVLRGVSYLAVLLASGAVAFAAFVGRRPTDRRRAAVLGAIAALVGLVATVLHVPVQAAAVSGLGPVAVLADGDALRSTLTSGFGQSALLRLVALSALVVLWRRRQGPDATAATLGPWLWTAAAAGLGSFLLDGHQRTVEPSWLLLGGDAVHLGGAAVWAGGLVLVYATLKDRRRDDDPAGAARVVARFSGVALWSVLALSVAGTAMSLPLVRSVDALTATTYGWLLLAKVGLVAVIVAIAVYNRRSLVPTITAQAVPAGGSVETVPPGTGGTGADATTGGGGTGDAWRTLTTTVRVEVVALAAIGVLTGFLATTQPAAEAAGLTGPVMETAQLTDDLDVDLVIDPAEPGRNALHIYVVEASGQPSGELEDLRMEFTYLDEGIGPIVVEPLVAGPGHWTANVTDLTFAGSWEVRVVAGEDRFTEHDVTIPFELAG